MHEFCVPICLLVDKPPDEVEHNCQRRQHLRGQYDAFMLYLGPSDRMGKWEGQWSGWEGCHGVVSQTVNPFLLARLERLVEEKAMEYTTKWNCTWRF